jgi:hypothetical protein
MDRTTRLALIWCVSVSCGIARGQDRPPASPYAPEPSVAAAAPTNEGVPAPAAYDAVDQNLGTLVRVLHEHRKVVVSVVDPDAKRSEVIKKIVDALEKSGITKSNAPVDHNFMYPGIIARIRVQLNTPYEKITALIKAMQYAGVQNFSLTKPGTDGKNILFLVANTPQRSNDIQRIDRAARHAAIENDLLLDVISTIPAAADVRATDPQAAESTARTMMPSTFDDSESARFSQSGPGLVNKPECEELGRNWY